MDNNFELQEQFIEAVRETGTIVGACRKTGVPKSTVYLQREKYADFSYRVEVAKRESRLNRLEMAHDILFQKLEEKDVSVAKYVIKHLSEEFSSSSSRPENKYAYNNEPVRSPEEIKREQELHEEYVEVTFCDTFEERFGIPYNKNLKFIIQEEPEPDKIVTPTEAEVVLEEPGEMSDVEKKFWNMRQIDTDPP